MAALSREAGSSASRDLEQRKNSAARTTGHQNGHAQLTDEATNSKKKKTRSKTEPTNQPALLNQFPTSSSSLSTSLKEEEEPFDPKSILPASKSAKNIARLRVPLVLSKQETTFECIDGCTRRIDCPGLLPEEQEHLPSTTTDKEPFKPFGIEAYYTRAVFNDVCYDFVHPGRWCPHSHDCYRIHPRDKLAHIAAARRDSALFTRMRMQKFNQQSSNSKPSPADPVLSAASTEDAGSTCSGASTKLDEPIRVKLPPVSVSTAYSSKPRVVNPRPQPAYSKLASSSRHRPTPPQAPNQSNDGVEHWHTMGGLKDTAWGGRNSTSSSGTSEENDDVRSETTPLPDRRNEGLGNPWKSVVPRWHTTGDEEHIQHEDGYWSDSNKTSDSYNQPPNRFQGRQEPIITVPANVLGEVNAPRISRPVIPLPPKPIVVSFSPVPQTPVIRHPRPKTNERCRKWLRNQCDKAYSCMFLHDDLDYDDEPAPPPKPESSNKLALVYVKRPPEKFNRIMHQHIRVVFGSGFRVNELSTGFESPSIVIAGLPDVPDSQILGLLKPFGDVTELRRSQTPAFPITAKVHFAKSSEAFAALNELHGRQYLGQTLEAKPVNSGSNRLVYHGNAVRFEWDAPCRNVYMGYSSQLLAELAIDDARLKAYEDFMTVGNIHSGIPAVGKVTVKFKYLPVHVSQDGMKIFGPHQGMVTERPNFNDCTPQDMIQGFKRLLSPIREKIVDVDIKHQPYRDGKMRVWVVFGNAKDAQTAAQSLNGMATKSMFGSKISAYQMKSVSFSLSPVRYQKVEAELRALQDKLFKQNKGYWISVSEKGAFFSIRISGDDIKELGRLKTEFERIMNGEPVYEGGKVVWDGFFGRADGAIFVQQLEREFAGVTIETVLARRLIRLFGVAEKRTLVRQRIIDTVKTRRARTQYTIPMSHYVASAYAADETDGFKALESQLGPGNVVLEKWNNQLVVTGDMDLYTTAHDAVFAFRQKHHLVSPNRWTGELCPACFNPVSSPMKLPCGHSWCRACLQRYLKVAMDRDTSFPLLCHGTDKKCGEPIPLFLSRDVLPAADFDAILESALTAHIQTHPEELHYCPTPNCPQVYRSAPEGIFMQCPECLTQICTHCHSDAHEGLNCSEVRDGDELFREWAITKGVKQCPNCKMAIEKNEGCHHMTCGMCKTHICWVCMQTFKDGYGIYGHMEAEHGGSGV